jgi:TolA-binding protein
MRPVRHPGCPVSRSVNLCAMRYAVILALLATTTLAAPPTTCNQEGEYERALCSYQRRNFAEAESAFRVIVERGDKDPATLRSIYFLARTLMKTGRFDEASALLIRIYSLDKAFYDAWNCDFLLGECRKALGR